MKTQKFWLWLIINFSLLWRTEHSFAQINFWEDTKGPPGGNITALTINSSDHLFAATFDRGAFRSTDQGSRWTPINAGLNTSSFINSFAINSSRHLFASGYTAGAFRSVDNGDNWTPINIGLTNTGVGPLAINRAGHLFVGAGDAIFRSTDNGDHWTAIKADLTTLGSSIRAIAINALGHIFVGIYGSSNTARFGSIFRSIDNGNNWTPIAMDGAVIAIAINSAEHLFAVIETGPPTAYVTTILRSGDHGDHWAALDAIRIDGTQVLVSALAFNAAGHIFAGSSDGAFLSTDNGEHWTPINDGLAIKKITVLAVDSRGYVFAGTLGGIFRSIQPTAAVQESAGDILTAFSLEQNYPNPFSPHGRGTPTGVALGNLSTTLRFNFSRPAQATLAIYNTLGQKVRSLLSQRFAAGPHQAVWDGRDDSGKPVPSGAYLLRLSGSIQNSHVALGQTKKIVVLE